MKIDVKLLGDIYRRFGDEESKEMFKNRLLYSITNDLRWTVENIKLVREGKELIEKIEKCAESGELVIFGAGMRGEDLCRIFENYPWKYFVDNYPKIKNIRGVPVISTSYFLEKYQGEYIFITPKFNNELIHGQLIQAGISEERIINVGKMQNELMKNQYFDLTHLKPAEGKEIFVDIGGYDGMTSVYFGEWSHGKGRSYILEPDTGNIEKCKENLANGSVEYHIIPKGAWCEETTLYFKANADVSSRISEEGESVICVTTIEKVMRENFPTFIKMDIEGAEQQALLGARQTISRCKPKLAISIYHKPEDIWKIPDIILQYNPSYRFYLRHYTLTESDTILYAVP